MRDACWEDDFWHCCQERHLAGQVAITAVGVYFDNLVGVVRQIRLGIVLMRVVTEMLRVDLAFMLTICSCRAPGELERQQCQQENEDQFFHGVNNSIEQVRELASVTCNPSTSKGCAVASPAINDPGNLGRDR
jgi:hypothetical protein